MKKVLFTVAVLAAMLSSKVYGQQELRLVSSSGEMHSEAHAKADVGAFTWSGNDVSLDDTTILALDHGSFFSGNSIDTYATQSIPSNASANATTDMTMYGTAISSSFATNPYIQLTSTQYSYCQVAAPTSFIYHAGARTCTSGRYGFTVTPNNNGT